MLKCCLFVDYSSSFKNCNSLQTHHQLDGPGTSVDLQLQSSSSMGGQTWPHLPSWQEASQPGLETAPGKLALQLFKLLRRSIFCKQCWTKARTIVKDLSHLSNELFSLLKSAKCFGYLRVNTERTQALGLLTRKTHLGLSVCTTFGQISTTYTELLLY